MRLAAQYADVWHSFGSATTLRHKGAILDQHGVDVGRDAAALVERSASVSRPPEDVAADLVDAGATLFVIGTSGPDYDLDLARRWVAWRDARVSP